MLDLEEAWRRLNARRTDRPASTPTPHIQIEPPSPSARVADLPVFAEGPRWPTAVLDLERLHRDRFEHLADAILDPPGTARPRVLLFTSCRRAEGRTTLLLALARVLRRRPLRTILLDADLTGPTLARALALEPHSGAEDVVLAGMPVEQAIHRLSGGQLDLLPLRHAVERPRRFLESPGWACLMARLRRMYDLVLLDGSPIFAGTSAALMRRSIDSAILVHHHGSTAERQVQRACEVLAAGGIPVLGLASTFVADAVASSPATRTSPLARIASPR